MPVAECRPDLRRRRRATCRPGPTPGPRCSSPTAFARLPASQRTRSSSLLSLPLPFTWPVGLLCTVWDESEVDKEDEKQWEDNWEDDNLEDDFSVQLRAELVKAGKVSA